MKKTLEITVIVLGVLALSGMALLSGADTSGCHSCDDVAEGLPQEVRIEYRDGTTRPACGLRCAGAMLAAYRMQDVKTIWVREQGSGKLIDAKKAFWVIRLNDRGREAFSGGSDAEAFSKAHDGRVVNFREAMAAVFSGMYDEIQKTQSHTGGEMNDDIKDHPNCAYCGMDRRQYAYSRVLLRYRDGTEVGLCSLHCAGIDLALHPEKGPAQILAATFDRRNLVDADKAVWVLGGSKQGVMSIRGKWAFEGKEEAGAFMREYGGSTTSFRNIMTAAFEDMWEIIR